MRTSLVRPLFVALALSVAMLPALPAEASITTPAALAVASGGEHRSSVRVQWAWEKGVSSYTVQASTSAAFVKVTQSLTVSGRASRPSGGRMAATVTGLSSSTYYHFRVRASSGQTKSEWSNAVIGATSASTGGAKTPAAFSWATAEPGPGPGEITFRWKHSGYRTTSYRIETALTAFSKNSRSLPSAGRNHRVYTVSARKRSFTMNAEEVADAGAEAGTGRHLVYRVVAVNSSGGGTRLRQYPSMKAVMPDLPDPYTSSGEPRSGYQALRVGSFNVRTARAHDARPWLARRDDVVDEILAAKPDITALQELGPGRADGKRGSTTGHLRMTTSLLATLEAKGADQYKLARTTPYVKAGTTHATQGARILYNSNVVELVSDCPEKTGSSSYSSSCSLEMPILNTDGEGKRRSAALARFRIKESGLEFWFASVHLDERHSRSDAGEAPYASLRAEQARAVVNAIQAANTDDLPVLLGGDFNSWQRITVGFPAEDVLLENGYLDTAAAGERTNMKYSTYNGFRARQSANSVGYGSRLDGIFIQNGSAHSFENVTKPVDSSRPSDHNLIVADVALDN